jgi:hypothetical protein
MQHARHVLLILIAAFLVGGLSACTTPKSPQQAVFQTKSQYEAALTAAVAYKRLPTCGEPVVQPCKRQTVLVQIQKADDVAAKALDSAENAVRTPGFGDNVAQSAITASRAALDALVAITSSLQVK